MVVGRSPGLTFGCLLVPRRKSIPATRIATPQSSAVMINLRVLTLRKVEDGAVATPADALAARLAAALVPLADPEAAVAMRSYMKDVAPYLGIATPARRAATMPIVRALGTSPDPATVIEAAIALAGRREREHSYTAADLLDRHVRSLDASHLDALRALVVRGAWWDTTDALAKVVNQLGRRLPEVDLAMERWVVDQDGWVRRVAIIHQLGRRADADLDRLFRFCLLHAGDPWFFTRKAIGWALRDATTTFPVEVSAFVRDHADVLSPLSQREAMKRLDRAATSET